MLYDKRWDKQTKADPFTLESLIAWLERQPAEQKYCYMEHGACLMAQYFRASGFPNASAAGTYVRLDGGQVNTDWPQAFTVIARVRPHTFGAALKRARKAAP